MSVHVRAQLQSLLVKATGKGLQHNLGNICDLLGSIPPEELLAISPTDLDANEHVHTAPFIHKKAALDVDREDNETFERIVLPPVQNPIVANDEDLIAVAALPPWAQGAFTGISKFNTIQSMVYHTAFNTSHNMLLSAPTGCGKTNVALLCTLQNFAPFFTTGHKKGKVVYIAPMKALAAEITAKFSLALEPLGIVVREVTGDTETSLGCLVSTDVIVTTPEKFDVMTRNSNSTGTQSDNSFLTTVSCVIIDEVHLLNDTRGCVLEIVVARIFRLIESTQVTRRIVAISATLPNWQDVAEFLRVQPENAYYFGREYRHVPLEQIFYGVKDRDPSSAMLNICFEHMMQVVEKGKQCLVFVHSRKETVTTAARLIERIQASSKAQTLFQPRKDLYRHFNLPLKKCKYENIRNLAEYCISVHHAGMVRRDRDLVETMFKDGLVKVLVCTSTLAWGVNLPANCVIIKGTFIGGIGVDRHLNYLELTQIMGRAGRPQFDTSGTGVLITEHKNIINYVKMQTEQLPIESRLHRHLENALNAEIVLGTVLSDSDAVMWLRYTFLYVRMRKNALVYGLKSNKEEEVLLHMHKMVREAAANLDKSKLIRYHASSGEFASTDLGRIASKYYVDFETIYNFAISLNPKLHASSVSYEDSFVNNVEISYTPKQTFINDEYILERLCECKEFETLIYRNDELEELTDLMAASVYKPRRGLNHITTKISLLIDAHISRRTLRTSSLMSDMNYVIQNTGRLLLAYFDVSTSEIVSGPPVGDVIYRWFLMFERQIWDLKCKQSSLIYHFCDPYHASYDKTKIQSSRLPTLSKLTASRLAKYDLETLLNLTHAELADSVKSKHEASAVQSYIRFVPYPQVNFTCQPITPRIAKVKVTVALKNCWSARWNGSSESFHIWICSDTRIINKTSITLTANNYKDSVEMFVPFKGEDIYMTIKTFSCRWLGIIVEHPFVTRRLQVADDGYTKLLDLLPLPTSALTNYSFLYQYKYFNPLQTQIFPHCYFSDDNLLVGAPTGSGKTVIAELSMFRLWQTQPRQKVVYIAPLKALAYERLKDWTIKFGKFKRVVEVTGDSHATASEIANSQIIITTPEKWDGISRHWKNRKYVRTIGLLVIDEVHLLGESRGAVLEAIVTRLSFISKFSATTTRLVCLSTALANTNQIADWLGVKTTKVFNFSPAVRPVACKLYINGFPIKAYCPRMNSMNKPAFSTITRHDLEAPVLVFVSSRRQTRTTAQDFLGLIQMKSVKWSNENTIYEPFFDEHLNTFVEHGIGIHHAGLQDSDRTRIEDMFVRGQIKVLIATSTLAWGVNLPAQIVIIKGTEYYDGKTKKYADYSVTDIMQMVGRAGRKLHDKEAYAYIYTESRKVDFYKAFMFSPFPAESSFHERIVDSLNSEIASGTVASNEHALEFLRSTFFYRRLQKNPMYYLNTEFLSSCNEESSTEDMAQRIVCICLKRLLDIGCISTNYNQSQALVKDNVLIPSVMGILSSQYYICTQTVATFTACLQRNAGRIGIFTMLRALANAKEFDEVPLRHNEDLYNMTLSSTAVMPIRNSDASNPHAKAFLLLQMRLFGLKAPIFDYNNDLKSVLDQLPRICQALIDSIACWRDLRTMQYALLIYKHLLTEANLLEQPLSFDGAADIMVKMVDVTSGRTLHGTVICESDNWYKYDISNVHELNVNIYVRNLPSNDDIHYLTFGDERSNVLFGFKKFTSAGTHQFRYAAFLRLHKAQTQTRLYARPSHYQSDPHLMRVPTLRSATHPDTFN
ncbi:DEAD-box helicase [Babesia ovata]|uniref:DEAD-box helicase n=1 Tax=Babesia ovata TaxID=189622 RepID=A0A2H6KEK3_9APIC|nr:DEAD-box helicase [Babesia ovata]GBE61423.1 DEAD-box helicase [Babesia ovata]